MAISGLKNSNKKKSKTIEDYVIDDLFQDVGQTGAPLIIELLIHFFDFQ